MIVYNSTKKDFVSDVRKNVIADKILESIKSHHIFGGQTSEFNSWQNSLNFMCNVVDTTDIDNETEISIEYQIPHTSKRVDFIISGSNSDGEDHIVVVELKAWQRAEKVDNYSKHTVRTYTGGDNRLVNHPSYQAFSYATFIKNFSAIVQDNEVRIQPCAYLHNYDQAFVNELNDDIYRDWIEEAPFFIKNQFDDLQSFIKKYVKYQSKDKQLLYRIDHGRIRPSKALQDALANVMRGNKEFILLDDQATAYDICVNAMEQCKKDHKRRTVIIQGGPGTGKSVLAINLLKHYIDQDYNSAYVTKNTAPRKAYLKLLTDSNVHREMNIMPLFRSPFGLSKVKPMIYDTLIIDEAHRLVKKMYGDFSGENQVKECIQASLLSIFLIDEDQQIIRSDIGSISEIKSWARYFNSEVIENQDTILKSQFRCNGSDAYIQLVNQILQLGESIPVDLSHLHYDIRVFENPNEMRDALRQINEINNKARMVAGYCYPWNVKNKRGDFDIYLPNGFKAKWNLPDDDTWAITPTSFEEVGCIHTAQGLEFDYVGVIIGNDLYFEEVEGVVKTNQKAISDDDKSSKIRTASSEEATRLIKNTYKTLLTRGQKGCFIYCEDQKLRKYIKSLIKGD